MSETAEVPASSVKVSSGKSRKDDREGKRDHILAAAAFVFAHSGYAKASVDEIAKRAGVGKGSVYQVAESKEELFILTVEREVRVWHDAMEKLIDESVPADQLLVSVSAEAMRTCHDNALLRDLFCGETSGMLARCEVRLRRLRSVGADHLTQIIRIGIRQGVWRAELQPELVAEVLQDMWVGAWMTEPSYLTPEAQFARVTTGMDLVLNGLLAR